VLCPVAPGELGHDFLRSLLHIVARQLDGHLSTPHPDDVESPPTDTSILDATTVAARREQSINSSASSASEYSLPATDVARGDGPAPTKRKLSLDVSHLDSQIPEEAKKKVSKVSFALDGDDSDSQSSSLDVLDSDSSADEMDEGGNPTPRQGIFHVHVVSDKKPQSENANDSDIDSDSLEIELSSDDEEFGTGNSGIFSVHVSSSDANAQADVDDSAALSSQHTKVPVSHEAEVQPWVYSIEELGVAKNGFVARVAATNVSGAKPIITATWSRGFVAAKWLSLKAHLDEAFSDHVSRFIGAGSELMKQIRMLTLSGRGPQQQEHGMLIVMTSFCDFFVMFHFIRQHNFYLGDNGGLSCASLFVRNKLVTQRTSCSLLFEQVTSIAENWSHCFKAKNLRRHCLLTIWRRKCRLRHFLWMKTPFRRQARLSSKDSKECGTNLAEVT